MARATRYETITAGDGAGTFEAYCALPQGGPAPGILLFQEIFGINDNMRTLADRLATAGYTVLVPDMFWRLEPRFERKDESGMADAFAMVQRFDFDSGVDDIQAAHGHLLSMAECSGSVGVIGFCLGGTLAFAAATRSRVKGRGPDAAVAYYGSAIHDLLGDIDRLECPAMFHYGEKDTFIPPEKIDQVERALEGRQDVQFHRYDAGHAFSNWDAPSMYDEKAASLAWSRTLAFLQRYLP